MSDGSIRFKETKRFDLQRRVVSHIVSESWYSIPHVSYLYEPDVTDFYETFNSLAKSEAFIGHKTSFNTVIMRVIIEGLKAAPDLNALVSYQHRKGEGLLHICEDINVSVAMLMPDGKMITPVILHTESMTLIELSDAAAKLQERAKNTNIDELLYQAVHADTLKELKRFNLTVLRRIIASNISFHRVKGLSGKEKERYYKIPESDRLTEKNLISGTITISNIGSIYREQRGFFGILEIIPPQIFAIGIGALQEKPSVYVEEDGQKKIGVRKILPLCLVFDHRAVDFGAMIPFLKKLDEIFLEPNVIHGW